LALLCSSSERKKRNRTQTKRARSRGQTKMSEMSAKPPDCEGEAIEERSTPPTPVIYHVVRGKRKWRGQPHRFGGQVSQPVCPSVSISAIDFASWRGAALTARGIKTARGGTSVMRRPPRYCHGFTDRHGKPRWYFRRAGFKKLPLPGLPRAGIARGMSET
jgi:hypothetical protein